MNKTGLQTFTAVLMAFQLSLPAAAAPVIGIATARGKFQVNSLRVSDNATLFDGSIIETGKASSEVRLADGSRVVLAPESKGTIYKDRAVFEKGQGQIAGGSGFSTQIGAFRIEQKQKGTAQFALLASNRVRVSVVDGAFAIRNARGLVLANVAAGNSVELSSQEGSTQTKVVGKLKKVDGKYVVTDETTNTTLELKGENLEQFVGKRVEVVGSAAGNTVTVATVTAAAAGGVSTTAVVAGVLIVSSVGAGLGLGLTQQDSKSTTSR